MNHDQLKDQLFAFHDGELSAESHARLKAHVDTCPSCQQSLLEWKDTSRLFLEPLRVKSSEIFVQQVMRRVRALEPEASGLGWPLFVRWAFPALALSVSSFAGAFVYTEQPLTAATPAIFLDEQEQPSALGSLSSVVADDQILSNEVTNP